MSGYGGRDRGRDRNDDRGGGGRDRDRSRSNYDDRRRDYGDRDGGDRYGGGRGGGRGRGRGGDRGGGFRGRGRGRGGGGRGGMKRAPEVDWDRENCPGRREVEKIKTMNECSYNPIKTKFCVLENSDQRRAVEEARAVEDIPLARLAPEKQTISGRKIQIYQNQFRIDVTDPKRMMAVYEVTVKPTSQGKFDKPLKREDNRNVIQNLSKKIRTPLKFDGENLLISNSLLHKIDDRCIRAGRESVDVYASVECTSQKKPRECEVELKKVHELSWQKLSDYINGDTDQHPSDVLQVLDIILKSDIANESAFVSKGRAMFPTAANTRMNHPTLIDGRQCWNGIVQSTRISSWKTELGNVNYLTLNADISFAMTMAGDTIDRLMEDYQNNEFALAESIKHLTFEAGGKFYKVEGFARETCDQVTFRSQEGRQVSMVDHWNNELRKDGKPPLRHTRIKAVKVKKGKGFINFPPEVCKLLPGQKPKTEKEAHKAALIRASAKPAPERLETIKNIVSDPDLYGNPSLEKEFGFKVNSSPMQAEATVLQTPTILDGDNREIKVADGEWKTKKFFNAPEKELKWISVYIGDDNSRPERNGCTRNDFEGKFLQQFARVGQGLGVKIGRPLVTEAVRNFSEFFEMCKKFQDEGKSLSSLNFVLVCGGNGNNGDGSKENYQSIKLMCECNFGALTQFVRQKSVNKDLENIGRGRGADICHGIWLKLNEKLGGTNWKVDVPLPPAPEPIMIVGCSFTHSPPGEQKPTMVGFSATTEQGGTGYVNTAVHQDPRLNIIPYENMEKAIKFMFGEFLNKNGNQPPSKIIWYRGGASVGSLQTILKNELIAIRKILESWRSDYKPGITFICTVRNHRQKMFAANEADMVGEGRNVPAGTAMTGYGGGTPDSFHFHLCSHAGIGTVNPTFYQVLHDDNDLELDNVVKMTNALTLDSKRCEKSISEPAPVRLASLRAERAYNHWEGAAHMIAEMRDDSMRNHFESNGGANKLSTRSSFKTSNFFL